MAQEQEPVRTRSFFDEPPKQKLKASTVATALTIVIVVFGGLGFFMKNAKFTQALKLYVDEKLDTKLIEPPPPISSSPRSENG